VGWVGDTPQVLSTALAAAAAGAAWASVKQGQRAWRASVEPDLHLQVLMDVMNNKTHLVITNVGGGVAKGAAFIVATEDRKAAGWVGDGFIAPGDKVVVSPNMALSTSGHAMVGYRTGDESSWAVAADGRREQLRKGRKGKPTTSTEAWKRLYPNIPLEGLAAASEARVEWVEKRALRVTRREDVPGL
jgi:hypothetical protein